MVDRPGAGGANADALRADDDVLLSGWLAAYDADDGRRLPLLLLLLRDTAEFDGTNACAGKALPSTIATVATAMRKILLPRPKEDPEWSGEGAEPTSEAASDARIASADGGGHDRAEVRSEAFGRFILYLCCQKYSKAKPKQKGTRYWAPNCACPRL